MNMTQIPLKLLKLIPLDFKFFPWELIASNLVITALPSAKHFHSSSLTKPKPLLCILSWSDYYINSMTA